jgi:hypothetical protein
MKRRALVGVGVSLIWLVCATHVSAAVVVPWLTDSIYYPCKCPYKWQALCVIGWSCGV